MPQNHAAAPEAPHTPRPPAGLPDYGRCAVMGVVNVTPDSFSDGGLWFDPEAAVAHARQLLTDGADLLDIGGESTRPGAARVDEDEELRRVVPVVRELAADGAVLSVDTMRAGVADAAVRAGARLVNDVSGGLADQEMLATVAAAGVPYVAMHWRGWSETMQRHAVYGDVAGEVVAELGERLRSAKSAGIPDDLLISDPGLGFAKTAEHNWQLLAALPELRAALRTPLLVGGSRKGFLGKLLADAEGQPRPADGRDTATAALSAMAARAGAWAVRVHDVSASADAVRVAAALTAHQHSAPRDPATTHDP